MLIKDNLYSFPWTNMMVNNCNSYFIDGETPTLIDPGLMGYKEELFKRMSADGLDPQKIQLIITTHLHPDHCGGMLEFDLNKIRLALSREEEEFFKEVGPKFFQMFGMEMPEFKVDFYLQEGELKLDDETYDVYITPGHSPGSASLYWPKHKALICGDVIFLQGVGRVDFPGGDGRLLIQSIERLSKLNIEYLLPGHGEVIVGKENIEENFRYIREFYYNYL